MFEVKEQGNILCTGSFDECLLFVIDNNLDPAVITEQGSNNSIDNLTWIPQN